MVFDEKFSNPRKGVEPLKRDSFVAKKQVIDESGRSPTTCLAWDR